MPPPIPPSPTPPMPGSFSKNCITTWILSITAVVAMVAVTSPTVAELMPFPPGPKDATSFSVRCAQPSPVLLILPPDEATSSTLDVLQNDWLLLLLVRPREYEAGMPWPRPATSEEDAFFFNMQLDTHCLLLEPLLFICPSSLIPRPPPAHLSHPKLPLLLLSVTTDNFLWMFFKLRSIPILFQDSHYLLAIRTFSFFLKGVFNIFKI